MYYTYTYNVVKKTNPFGNGSYMFIRNLFVVKLTIVVSCFPHIVPKHSTEDIVKRAILLSNVLVTLATSKANNIGIYWDG